VAHQSDRIPWMARRQDLPEVIEVYRDGVWRREAENRIEDAPSAEKYIERVGFCSAMTDCRRPGPSLYIAVCGRRDAHMPRNVQKDPESRLAWTIKDDVMRRGRVYYGKLLRNRSTFIARRLLSSFNAIWGVPREKEGKMLLPAAQAVLRALRREWEMGTRELRQVSRIERRLDFNKALDELQKTFKVIPSEVIYKPTFTYIWSLAESRFQDELHTRVDRETGLREIARAYMSGAGMTFRGELTSVTGLSRPDAGSAHWSLVDDGDAERVAPGVYRWRGLTAHPLSPEPPVPRNDSDSLS
ncbi:MAG: AlkZ-related protein, partial [Pyrinomonadaceae bacterium]